MTSPPSHLEALCIRTKMIGGGNHFEVLIPLSEIAPEGHTYRIIRASEANRPYVPFVNGIEPYTTEIMRMPQGWERYEIFLKHEADANLKALALLRHAFPDSAIDATSMVLWNEESLPDGEVRVRISRDGILMPSAPRRRPRLASPQP